jgi:hypothetical protein
VVAWTVGLVVFVILLVIAGVLVTSDGGILEDRGRLGAVPLVSPSGSASEAPGLSMTPRPAPAGTGAPVSEPLGTMPDQPSTYSCEDREIRDATTSRWQLGTVLAGSRRGFERVTFELARRGDANRSARITFGWMSPQEARGTFGLPRFDGRRGLLVTFGAQVTTTGTQLIGPLDLRAGGIETVSGVYRFVDFEGQVRTFIAIRDRACARVRAAELEDQDGTSRRATILIDLGVP